jgi:ATP-dependent Clp protease adaptor protein ClpS
MPGQVRGRRELLLRARMMLFSEGMSERQQGEADDVGVVTRTRTERKLKTPKLYKVLLLNDDYTTMEFVVYVLQSIFRLPESEAVQIMLHVHKNGLGVAGVYPREIAETRIAQVEALAREYEYPLRCSMEEA